MNTVANSAPESGASPYIREITVQNFMSEVIQASLQVPVLVYFTASWCGPCKQYGPILEKVVNEAKGRVKLARVDIDKNPQLAQQFRVQSVPMVFIFMQGQPLDAFAGALSESQLKQMLASILGEGPEEEAVKATLEAAEQLLAQGNAEEAAQYFQAILAQQADSIDAIAGLASAYITLKRLDEAKALLDGVPAAQANHEKITSAKAALALISNAPSGEVSALQAKLAKNADDHQSRLDLANAYFVGGQQEEAINELLTIITKDRDWNEGAARAQLLKIFEALGFSNPLAAQGRKKLSSILFA